MLKINADRISEELYSLLKSQMANLRKDSVDPDPIHILPEGYEIKERPGHGGRAKGSKNLQPKKKRKNPGMLMQWQRNADQEGRKEPRTRKP